MHFTHIFLKRSKTISLNLSQIGKLQIFGYLLKNRHVHLFLNNILAKPRRELGSLISHLKEKEMPVGETHSQHGCNIARSCTNVHCPGFIEDLPKGKYSIPLGIYSANRITLQMKPTQSSKPEEHKHMEMEINSMSAHGQKC